MLSILVQIGEEEESVRKECLIVSKEEEIEELLWREGCDDRFRVQRNRQAGKQSHRSY